MKSRCFILMLIAFTALTGSTHGAYHAAAEAPACLSNTGKVLDVVNDELFTITVCGSERVFREFSYCYGVEKGDTVMFHSNPENCKMTGFSVMKNDVQCGVLCPD